MAKHPRSSSNPHRSARTSAAQPPSPAATAVRDLAIAGRHEQAVAAATAALADPRGAPAARLALLEARLDSLLALLRLDDAEADADEMLALARRTTSASDEALALACLAQVQTRQERTDAALVTAAAAVAAARRSRRRDLVALALLRQAAAMFVRAPADALPAAEEAASQFAALGLTALQGQAVRVLAAARMALDDTPGHRALMEKAIALARAGGDRDGKARAINSLYSSDPDLAQRLRGLHQALRVAEVRSALEMIEMIELLNVERGAAGKAPLAIGIGIASGEMIAGYTGTQRRATYTCIGDTVNLAARLEAHTKEAQRAILVDRATLESLPPDVQVEVLGPVALKGITPAVEVFAVECGQKL